MIEKAAPTCCMQIGVALFVFIKRISFQIPAYAASNLAMMRRIEITSSFVRPPS